MSGPRGRAPRRPAPSPGPRGRAALPPPRAPRPAPHGRPRGPARPARPYLARPGRKTGKTRRRRHYHPGRRSQAPPPLRCRRAARQETGGFGAGRPGTSRRRGGEPGDRPLKATGACPPPRAPGSPGVLRARGAGPSSRDRAPRPGEAGSSGGGPAGSRRSGAMFSLPAPKLASSCTAFPLKHHLPPHSGGFYFFDLKQMVLNFTLQIPDFSPEITGKRNLPFLCLQSFSLNSPSGNPGFKWKQELKSDPNKLCANIMKLLCLPAGGHSLRREITRNCSRKERLAKSLLIGLLFAERMAAIFLVHWQMRCVDYHYLLLIDLPQNARHCSEHTQNTPSSPQML